MHFENQRVSTPTEMKHKSDKDKKKRNFTKTVNIVSKDKESYQQKIFLE